MTFSPQLGLAERSPRESAAAAVDARSTSSASVTPGRAQPRPARSSPDHALLALEAEGAEVPSRARTAAPRGPARASVQHRRKWPASQHVAVDREQSATTLGSLGQLLDALAALRTGAPDRPVRNLLADLRRREAVVLAVVPLGQVVAQLGLEARQPRRLPRPAQRARQHPRELAPPKRLAHRAACCSPSSVSGRSVRPVCRPARLHSVSPCRTSSTSTRRATLRCALCRSPWQGGLTTAIRSRSTPRRCAQLGYRTVDLLVEWLEREAPPLRRASPRGDAGAARRPAARAAGAVRAILEGLHRDVLPFASRDGHPRFFGFIPFTGTWPGALGDLIASACNLYAGSWMESAGPSQVELEVLGWFKEWIGYPAEAAGSLVSGGSAGEPDRPRLRARDARRPDARRPRALRLRPGALVDRARGADPRLPARSGAGAADRRRLPARAGTLAAAMEADVAAGPARRSLVAANGRRDEHRRGRPARRARRALPRARRLAARRRGLRRLRGTRRPRPAARDSSWPTRSRSTRTSGSTSRSSAAACSCGTGGAAAAFEMLPGLPARRRGRDGEVNFSDLGPAADPLGARAQALGLAALLRRRRLPRRRSRASLELAARAAARGRGERDARADGAALARRRLLPAAATSTTRATPVSRPRSSESGLGLVSTTRLHGRFALRLCVLNHTSGPEDVERVLAFLETAEPEAAASPSTSATRRSSAAGPACRRPTCPRCARCRSSPGSSPTRRRWSPSTASLREAAAGETIVEQWSLGAEFFVILEGTADGLGRR